MQFYRWNMLYLHYKTRAGSGVSVFWQIEQSTVLRAGGHQGHVLPGHVVRGAALAHRVHPRHDEDLLSVLRDPQRLVLSVHVERHLLAAAPQQPPSNLVLTVGLEVRDQPSTALSVTKTVPFGFRF